MTLALLLSLLLPSTRGLQYQHDELLWTKQVLPPRHPLCVAIRVCVRKHRAPRALPLPTDRLQNWQDYKLHFPWSAALKQRDAESTRQLQGPLEGFSSNSLNGPLLDAEEIARRVAEDASRQGQLRDQGCDVCEECCVPQGRTQRLAWWGTGHSSHARTGSRLAPRPLPRRAPHSQVCATLATESVRGACRCLLSIAEGRCCSRAASTCPCWTKRPTWMRRLAWRSARCAGLAARYLAPPPGSGGARFALTARLAGIHSAGPARGAAHSRPCLVLFGEHLGGRCGAALPPCRSAACWCSCCGRV